MNTLESLVDKELTINEPASLEELLNGQIKMGIKIPADYCYLLMSSNGCSTKKGFEVTIDQVTPIAEVNDFVNLEWLIKERAYDLEDQDAEIYRDRFLKIAGCFNQDRLLIGYDKEVVNEIHYYEYDECRIVKVCDSIFEFINNHLMNIDE